MDQTLTMKKEDKGLMRLEAFEMWIWGGV